MNGFLVALQCILSAHAPKVPKGAVTAPISIQLVPGAEYIKQYARLSSKQLCGIFQTARNRCEYCSSECMCGDMLRSGHREHNCYMGVLWSCCCDLTARGVFFGYTGKVPLKAEKSWFLTRRVQHSKLNFASLSRKLRTRGHRIFVLEMAWSRSTDTCGLGHVLNLISFPGASGEQRVAVVQSYDVLRRVRTAHSPRAFSYSLEEFMTADPDALTSATVKTPEERLIEDTFRNMLREFGGGRSMTAEAVLAVLRPLFSFNVADQAVAYSRVSGCYVSPEEVGGCLPNRLKRIIIYNEAEFDPTRLPFQQLLKNATECSHKKSSNFLVQKVRDNLRLQRACWGYGDVELQFEGSTALITVHSVDSPKVVLEYRIRTRPDAASIERLFSVAFVNTSVDSFYRNFARRLLRRLWRSKGLVCNGVSLRISLGGISTLRGDMNSDCERRIGQVAEDLRRNMQRVAECDEEDCGCPLLGIDFPHT